MIRNQLYTILLFAHLIGCDKAFADNDPDSIIRNGKINGVVRNFYNYRDFETNNNTHSYALGGYIHAETGSFYGVSASATYYVSNDIGTRSNNPANGNPNLPENVEVLGEAYLQYSMNSTHLRVGRQKVDTPFANPSDSFMIPVTYEAVSVSAETDLGLVMYAHYLDRIKNRPDDKFRNVSKFSANRFNTTSDPGGMGVWIAGARLPIKKTNLEAWGYLVPDQFWFSYLQIDQKVPEILGIMPSISGQWLHQQEQGDSILGAVQTNAFGIKLSGNIDPVTLTLAWNHVEENSDAFNDGGILSPFTFSTGPIFTNAMVQTMENSTPGNALKLSFISELGDNVVASVSHARFWRESGIDANETDVDVTYNFLGAFLNGLSFRVRLGVIGANNAEGRMIELRPQLQYTFAL